MTDKNTQARTPDEQRAVDVEHEGGSVRVSVTLPKELFMRLEAASVATGSNKNELMKQAFVLLDVARTYHSRGFHIGASKDPEKLSTEFVSSAL